MQPTAPKSASASASAAANTSAPPKAPSLNLNLSRDGLKVLLSVSAAASQDEKLTLDDILAAGERLGLTPQRFNPETLGEIADLWNHNHEAVHDAVVAESFLPPKPGEDGRVEWIIPVPWAKAAAAMPANAQPSPGMEGSAGMGGAGGEARRDMREVQAIVAVVAGQLLLRVIPPGKGKPGEDLLGRLLPAMDGKPSSFKPGLNIDESGEEPGLFIAKKAGFLRLKDGRPEVQECFVVEGDVDYGTGNIKYEKSASIRGDVQDGFAITVGGDLEIGGTVGDCRLVVGGNVAVQGGFQGKGQGLLLSKGKVSLGFCGNQVVKAYGSIEVLKEAYSMHLFTRDSLLAHGPIVGGRVIAGTSIECQAVGNEHGTPTSLEIGFDFVALEGLQEVEERLKSYSEAQLRLQSRMLVLKDLYRARGRMDPEMAREMVALRQSLEKLAQALPILNTRKNLLSETLRKGALRPGLVVKVERQVHAGTTIRIGHEHIRLTDNLPGPRRFAFDEGRIKIF